MNAKLSSYIGLAVKAGGAVFGEDMIFERLSQIKVIIVDETASEKYKERLKRRAGDVPVFIGDVKCALKRDNVNAVGIKNEDLADAIIKLLR